jgi:hypothetical protein
MNARIDVSNLPDPVETNAPERSAPLSASATAADDAVMSLLDDPALLEMLDDC